MIVYPWENQAGHDPTRIIDFGQTWHKCWVWYMWMIVPKMYVKIFNSLLQKYSLAWFSHGQALKMFVRCSESFLAVKSKSATMWVQLSLFYICIHCVHSRKRHKWSWNCLYYVFRLPSEDNLTKCLLIQKPRCEFPSVLDMLLIDNPVVTNCLIDQVHILYSFISSHVYDILVFTCCEKINAQSFLFVINCLL